MLYAEGTNWNEFFSGAVQLVTAIGAAIAAVMAVWNRRTSTANSTAIKATLADQNDELATIRVDVEAGKQATREVKQAATEVRIAAVEVAKAADKVQG